MSEGIWVYVFLIFCGFWFAVILVGIGVMIGGRMDKRKLCERDNRSNLHDDCVHNDRSGVFCDKGEIPVRHNDRQNLGEMGTEEMKEMLRILIQLIERIETL